jgi:hypothetical protein
MSYKEINIYDGPFPTFDQMMSGDPAAPPFPKEIWLQQLKAGEFAVRYKDFKTGLARNPQGHHVKGSEICRVFDDLAEARADSRQITQEHWTIRCFIYDHAGTQVDSISNNAQVNKFAARLYAGILVWGTLFAAAGMAVIWVVYRAVLFFFAPSSTGIRPLNWLGWSAFAAAGLVLGIWAWYMRLRFKTTARVKRVRASFTPEEMKRFEELNTLHGTADPAERERFLKLMNEYQLRAKEAWKKEQS